MHGEINRSIQEALVLEGPQTLTEIRECMLRNSIAEQVINGSSFQLNKAHCLMVLRGDDEFTRGDGSRWHLTGDADV